MESLSSASGSMVQMPSVTNRTPTPISRSARVQAMASNKLREKRLTSLVTISWNFPARASSNIRLNWTLFLVLVPLMPWSA